MATRKNKRNKKIPENGKKDGIKNGGKTRRNNLLHFQKTKLYKLYLAELEKLRGGDLEAVEKFMGGDWLDNLGIRKIGSLFVESMEVPYQVLGIAGIYLKRGIEAVWISKLYHWIKENIWENSFIRGFFDIFMKVGGKIGEAIYFIYILLTKVITDIMEKKFKSVWLWVLTVITSLGVFDWAGSSGVLGSSIGSFFTGSVNSPIIGFFNTFNFWNFLGVIIGGIFTILGNIWGGVTTFISSTIFFSSFFQVILVIAVLWGLNALRLDYNKSNPELIELSKPKKLRATVKNQRERGQDKELDKTLPESVNERAPSVSESSTKSTKRLTKKRISRKSLQSIPEEVEEESQEDKVKDAVDSVAAFNKPYKYAVKKEELNGETKEPVTGDFFKNLRANFTGTGKVPKPEHPYGLKGGGFKNLSTKKLLEQLNKTSKTTIDEVKESNGMGFQLALLCGFIKGGENGYVFTPQAAKTLKSIIISSQDSINKNCVGVECGQKGGNKAIRKSNEELGLDELDSIIETLKAFEFVQTATVHALVRQSNKSNGLVQNDDSNVLSHLKKEDIEWLQERDPKQIEAAMKLGILTKDLELTKVADGISKDGDVINGISIKEQYAKFEKMVAQ